MTLKDTKHIYFIGIGGIGMSAIARYFVAQGKKVSGYDKTRTILTENLENEGIYIQYTDEINLIPKDIDLVIFTPAIPKDHKGYEFLIATGIPVMKRAEVLGLISRGMKSIGIAGTHGKTTTSSLTAHMLKVGGIDVSAFLGGIAVDYNSNFLIGKSDVVVLEADEYDRSFLQLSPYIASISSMDADHLDIYGNKNEMISGGYKAFASKIKDNGYLILKQGLLQEFNEEEVLGLTNRGVTIFEFGKGEVQIKYAHIRVVDGKFVFNYSGLGFDFEDLVSNMPGQHNVENACVAITASLICGVKEANIRKALAEFKGIQRRFEKILETSDLVFIDDYAHHPGELKVAIDAARKLYPSKKITGIFQPHLYSRTKDFAIGFAEELDKLDEVILLDIYPARELPMEGVSSEMILNLMHQDNKVLTTKDLLLDILKNRQIEVLMTLGAGDIDTMVPKIKRLLEK